MALALAEVRDVCFAHWPVPEQALADRLPDALVPATTDGRAWASVLAQRTLAGVRGLPFRYVYPQVALRTYVVPADAGARTGTESAPNGTATDGDGDAVGVSFLHVEADGRLATVGGRHLFGLPYHGATIRHERVGDSFSVRSVDGEGRETYAATFEPTGPAPSGEREAPIGWLTDRVRYYRSDGASGLTAHSRWPLRRADASVEADALFDRAGLPAPDEDPFVRYSPGVEIRLTERP